MRSWCVGATGCDLGRGPTPGSSAPAGVYRPRHPERTPLYRVLEARFEDYRRVYADRFEPEAGPWRTEVEEGVNAYLDCGRLHGGFARIRCPRCGAEHLLAFSCRTRNLCPSCQSKRSALFGEWLVEAVLLDVPHRHVVFTVPKRLRGLIERERGLHGVMAQAAWEVLRELGGSGVRAGGPGGGGDLTPDVRQLRRQLPSPSPRDRDGGRVHAGWSVPSRDLAEAEGAGRGGSAGAFSRCWWRRGG